MNSKRRSESQPSTSGSASGRYARRRREILLAAAAEFAEKGYHGCRTQDIADQLGLKQASLYYYFPTKEKALEAVCLYAVSEATERVEIIVQNTESSFAEKIQHIFHDYLFDLQTQRSCMIVLTEQRRYLPAGQQALIREQARRYRNLLLDMFHHAYEAGEIRRSVDCQLAVRMLIGLCHSAATWLQHEPERALEHVIHQYTALFCNGVQQDTTGPTPTTLKKEQQ